MKTIILAYKIFKGEDNAYYYIYKLEYPDG